MATYKMEMGSPLITIYSGKKIIKPYKLPPHLSGLNPFRIYRFRGSVLNKDK